MADINYTPHGWVKGNVLTAELLNASENALKEVVDRVNGKTGEGNLDPSSSIATQQYVINAINALDFDYENTDNLKTISTINQANGQIQSVTCQDIGKANGEGNEATFGIVKAGTNLSANNGILSVIDNPTFNTKIQVGTITSPTDQNASIFYTPATFNRSATFNSTSTFNNDITTAANKATTLGGTLTVTGTSTFNNTLTVNGNYETSLGGALSVTGNSTLNGTLTVANNQSTTLNGTLEVKKATTFKDDLIHPLGYYTVTIGQETQRYNCPDKTFSGNYKNITLGAMSEGLEGETADILSRSSEIILAGASTTINTLTNIINGTTTISNLIATTATATTLTATTLNVTNINNGITLLKSNNSYFLGIDVDNNLILQNPSSNNIFTYDILEDNITFNCNITSLGFYSLINEPNSDHLSDIVESAAYIDSQTNNPVYLRILTAAGNEYIKGNLSIDGDILTDYIKPKNNTIYLQVNKTKTESSQRTEYGSYLKMNGVENDNIAELSVYNRVYQPSGSAQATSGSYLKLQYTANSGITFIQHSYSGTTKTVTLTVEDIEALYNLIHPST